MHHSKYFIPILLISLFLGSCKLGPDFHSPTAPAVDRYTESKIPNKTVSTPGPGGKAQYFISKGEIPAEWWFLFRCKQLNDLIEQGLANNPNLQAAQAALRQAHENYRAEVGSGFLPAISAQFIPERQRSNFLAAGVSPENAQALSDAGLNLSPSSIYNLYNASVGISYTLDLFGGIRRRVEASRAQIDYERFEWEAAYLTLTANIVTTAISEASLRAQIAATNDLIQVQKDQLNLLEKQLELGFVPHSSVLSQKAQVAQAQATLPPLQKNLAQIRHSLAALVGSLPSESQLPSFELGDLHLPRELPTGLPSSLVQQRPDIRASEALLHQASAQIGVATANLLPQITLVGNRGYIANTLENLFEPTSLVWNLESQITAPLFQGGALRAQRRAAIAAFEQASAQYRETVLLAFQNVADALHAIEKDAQLLQAETATEQATYKLLKVAQAEFNLGGTSYFSLLDTQRQYQQTRIAKIQAQAARYADTAALFQALGGGWWNRDSHPFIMIKENTNDS